MAVSQSVSAAPKKQRLVYVDIAKGIAMLCIIAGHFGIVSVNHVVYTFHVPLFFLLSGYFLSTRQPLPDYLKTKARQLLVPYYIGCVGIAIFGFFMSLALGGTFADAVERVCGIVGAAVYAAGTPHVEPFAVQQIGLLWFLWALFIGGAVVRFALFSKVPGLIVSVAAFLGWSSAQFVWLPLSVQAGLMASFFMYLGYWAKTKDFLSKETNTLVVAACVVLWCVCLYFGMSVNIVSGFVGGGVVAIAGSIAASYLIVLFSRLIERHLHAAARFLSYFGQVTLVVMLFHAVADYTFPWYLLYSLLEANGIARWACHILVVFLNVLWPLFGVWLTFRIPPFAKLIGAKRPLPYISKEAEVAKSPAA